MRSTPTPPTTDRAREGNRFLVAYGSAARRSGSWRTTVERGPGARRRRRGDRTRIRGYAGRGRGPYPPQVRRAAAAPARWRPNRAGTFAPGLRRRAFAEVTADGRKVSVLRQRLS